MASVVMTYQRFESEHVVGRHYPWDPYQRVRRKLHHFRRSTSQLNGRRNQKSDLRTPTWTPQVDLNVVNQFGRQESSNSDGVTDAVKLSDLKRSYTGKLDIIEFDSNVMVPEVSVVPDEIDLHVTPIDGAPVAGARSDSGAPAPSNGVSNEVVVVAEVNTNITDDDKLQEIQLLPPIWERALLRRRRDYVEPSMVEGRRRPNNLQLNSNASSNVPDDDLIDHIEDMKSYLRRTGEEIPSTPSSPPQSPSKLDRTPSLPPPPRPSNIYPHLPPLQRLSKVKDMLIFDAEKYIIDHVPRLPPNIFDHHHQEAIPMKLNPNNDDGDNHHAAMLRGGNPRVNQKETNEDEMALNPNIDETDFILPTRKRTINGLEQDDIFGKFISFTGWILFLVMRMLALSTFSVFFLRETIYLLAAHYALMLVCLFCETRFHAKLHRMTFYIFLAYIYLFCLLEFKIKFIHIKTWYIGYFFLVFMQNLLITQYWYLTQYFYTWWFEFLYNTIIWSGCLSLACNIFYYFVLRPKEKILSVNVEAEQ